MTIATALALDKYGDSTLQKHLTAKVYGLGQSALHLAVLSGSENCVAYLVQLMQAQMALKVCRFAPACACSLRLCVFTALRACCMHCFLVAPGSQNTAGLTPLGLAAKAYADPNHPVRKVLDAASRDKPSPVETEGTDGLGLDGFHVHAGSTVPVPDSGGVLSAGRLQRTARSTTVSFDEEVQLDDEEELPPSMAETRQRSQSV